jgi:metallo-beta-lactamase family protein
MELIHHGGHEGVTGSCHQLRLDGGGSILVDCGLFQGDDAKRHPDLEIEFPIDDVHSMILTHVHIDHVGRLPYLLAAGFRGPIYCSKPTAMLLPMVLQDALRIGFTKNERMISQFQKVVQSQLRPVDYDEWTEIEKGATVRLQPAGHILGSSYVELDYRDQRIVFSGDLGAPCAPLLKDPRPPERADILVLESTYGDKVHEGRDQRQETLETVLRRTLEDQGVTIIPAFSLGRTQELLYEMNGIFERIQRTEGRSLMKAVDVIVDSPLASRFTEIYKDLQPYWDKEAHAVMRYDEQPLVFENLTTIGDHDEHQSTLRYLQRSGLPAVVVAGSGMCTGGRIMNYLEAFLDRPNTDVLFVGYQGRGTPGRAIQRGGKSVQINGRQLEIRAKTHSISGYSAHADQQNLIDFCVNMPEPPGEVVLVHGETGPKAALEKMLQRRGISVS